MMKQISLTPIEEHNKAILNRVAPMASRPNGLACPECGAELCDTHQGITLASLPPQKDVHCPSCGWKGYRFV